jgi:DNA transposition AAA+ family ATPase
MSRHFLDLPDANTVPTGPFKLTARVVRDVVNHLAMGAIYGDAGSGKTYATEAGVERHPDVESWWFTFEDQTTPRDVANTLLDAVTGVPHEGTRYRMTRDLVEVMAEKPRLLIIDEAQNLNKRCIEHLRHLHDQPLTTFGLLFVGGNECWNVLSRYPMLLSRIWRRVEFERLDDQQVVAIMPRFHPVLAEARPELLLFIDDHMGHGIFRNWAAFTLSAAELCAEHRLKTVTEQVARNVFKLHGGAWDAA